MASLEDIRDTYDYMDELFRATFGPTADITAALFGNEDLTLEEAQTAKHKLIIDSLNIKRGSRVLDVGCGWGPMLRATADVGAEPVGIALSPRQVAACRKSGLEAYLMDWDCAECSSLGEFDAIVCVGAMEHFATPEQYESGKASEIYERFFRFCNDHLTSNGRLYVQTMVQGERAPHPSVVSLKAKKNSDEYKAAVVRAFYAGSWPPESRQLVESSAEQWFTVDRVMRGRDDYIRTMIEWRRIWRPTPRKLLAASKLVPKYIRDPKFRRKVECLREGYNRRLFEADILDHYRFVFAR